MSLYDPRQVVAASPRIELPELQMEAEDGRYTDGWVPLPNDQTLYLTDHQLAVLSRAYPLTTQHE